MQEINKIKKRLEELPTGTLVYKNINGKKQPYLQSTINGKSVSYYIKVSERENILLQIEEREQLKERLKRLNAYPDKLCDILRSNPYMDCDISIGIQDFKKIITSNRFYIDKTEFIYEWWTSNDDVTLITRPRRFGKTLMLSCVQHFFSNEEKEYNIFENLSVWTHASMHKEYSKYPVIFLSLSDLKGDTFEDIITQFRWNVGEVFGRFSNILISSSRPNIPTETAKRYIFDYKLLDHDEIINSVALLSQILYKHYGQKPIILLDEYDTPLQEAYLHGFYDEMAEFIRKFFNLSFKKNQYYKRVLITGITKVSKNSMFSDMNNLVSFSLIDDKYSTYFGFTEDEVINSLKCRDNDTMLKVKELYDGFTIGSHKDIYNPWSIINYLRDGRLQCYWANTASNNLISQLILSSDNSVKKDLEILLHGGTLKKTIDDNISFHYLDNNSDAIWMLLFYTGYLKAENLTFDTDQIIGDLSVTNKECMSVFRQVIHNWFSINQSEYSSFIKALLTNDIDVINYSISEVSNNMVSYFDVGYHPSSKAPERFYHGLVLGMLVELKDKYIITSNRESGYGRYDIMMMPLSANLPGIIMEFKVRDSQKESDLNATANNAINQIVDKQYASQLISSGLDESNILLYGFAFEGKNVLVKSKKHITL